MTDRSTRRADWIIGSLLGVVVLLLVTAALVGIGEALEQAYDQGYRDGATGAPYRMPAFGRLAP